MSAGNIPLSTSVYAPGTFPYAFTILGIGNYWIEEIDFVFSYFTTSAANTVAASMFLETSGALIFWQQEFALISSAASTVPLNLPITSRPRIFLPRGNNISINVTGPNVAVTALVFALNLYGRSLP